MISSYQILRSTLASVLLAGCAASSTYRPLTIAVQDAESGQPLPLTHVHARTLSFYMPDEPHLIVDPAPPRSDRGVTGEDGSVRLEVLDGHPVQLVIIAPGRAPVHIDLDVHPGEPTDWVSVDGISVQLRPQNP